MALASGTKLGPYEIQLPLGAGGTGEVYRARDTRLDRTVAVKIPPSHLSENIETKQRFDREARLRKQFEIHGDDGVDFDGLAVQERGLIAPLADGFDGGARKIGIHLAIQHLQLERPAVHAYYRVKQHRPLRARSFRALRVLSASVDEIC